MDSSKDKKNVEPATKKIRVAYLFVGPRRKPFEAVLRGENHGAGFWGLLHLEKFGITSDFLEPEQFYPEWVTHFLRKILSAYWIHLCIFWKIFSYDIIFTSTAFGTQLIHTLLRLRRPLWVMHDFNITGFLGERKTLKQKIFAFMVSRCAGIVTLSKKEEVMLTDYFPHLSKKIAWIPFGADLNFFAPMPTEEKKQILVVGTDPDRDYKTLFKACEGLNIPVVVTTLSSRLTPLAPLPHFVEVRRFSPQELVREYNRSALVVIPLDTTRRLNDAMGCSSLFEAMAMGKAIIATRTFTMESYITDGENGLLVRERDADELRAAIKNVFTNDALRRHIAANARAFAEKNLEINACTKKLADFFNRIFI
jgi:glycosyltransferase involved in cell wall biosynthesis